MAFWKIVSNILSGHPKVRWKILKTPFFKQNFDDAVRVHLKNTPFRRFLDTGAYGQ